MKKHTNKQPKDKRGGYRENAKRPKKFPGYETKYIKVLTPWEFESGLRAAIDAYLDGVPKKPTP